MSQKSADHMTLVDSPVGSVEMDYSEVWSCDHCRPSARWHIVKSDHVIIVDHPLGSVMIELSYSGG